MVRAWTIARNELVRMLRDRSNIFFVLLLPLLLVVFIGAQFGGSLDTRLGVVAPDGDEAVDAFIADLQALDGIVLDPFDDVASLRDEIDRGLLSGGVVVPEDYGTAITSVTPTVIAFVGRPEATSSSLRALVSAVVARQAAPGQAAAIAAPRLDQDPAELRPVALEVQDQVAGIEVSSEQLGTDELEEEFGGLGQFDLGASSQLFLFTFLTALFGAAALIQTRQYGVARRMLSTSTSMRTIVVGQSGGRFLVALTQAAYIIVATLVLFRVDWGDPLATGVVVLAFCAVAAAVGLLIGATLRNDSQASGVALGLGLGLAALGGSMVPLELYPETMRRIARVTPHAWANEAMAEIVRRDGTLVDVLPQIGVLTAMALGLLALGAWSLQRTLTR
jgi:ABC-2 type transport system permease protein